MKKLLLAALLLVPADALAQFSTRAEQEYSHALTAAGRFGTPRYTTALLPSCSTANLGALAYDTTVSGLKICNGSAYVVAASQSGVGIFATSPTVTSLGLTTGTMTLVSTGVLASSTSAYSWTNAMVAALGASLTGDITIATLPAKTVLDGIFVVINSAAATGKKATGTITLTGAPSPGVKAQGTITMGGVAVANETFAVGAQTFTWKASRGGVGQVTIGADAPAAVTNIVTAITADLATVTAVDGTADTVVVTAAAYGTGGNAIVFTEASTNMTVNGAGTLGTTTLGVAADQFTVGAQQFTIVDTRAGAGQVTKGATAAASVTNIVTAVNADLATVDAVDGTGDVVDLSAATAGVGGNALALTEDLDTGNVMAVSGAGTLAGGEDLTSLTISCGRTGAGYVDWIDALVDGKASPNTVYGDAAADRGALVGFDLPSYTGTTVAKCHFISVGTFLENVLTSTGTVILKTTLVP